MALISATFIIVGPKIFILNGLQSRDEIMPRQDLEPQGLTSNVWNNDFTPDWELLSAVENC
jgi:hypothetical protein